ncbi:MAG: nitrate ABC transporter ATP-binding protein [Candidatus Dactylopiibacterium carminicum]|uniref:ABC transporter ATP-binding protein n=1 Tax=Candidatus Dactylopiibacterium carminicum TaxID=857335 RepID=A0A272ERR5_9RHOO|nr:ABC transporter ATP-binding protein [Candidatus Dactylopiibacterium carminicum]KAF7598866.1 ABC transporter ATP-binding protein [Candidatus Dactylopiibacterium carminicum]PAS92782.1 MAG: nitrate ABC transporter ATP-binding protein [Candidatus Dactylopiibacterium carminicum]PAS96231.1 MAG: nitrate ABC transporter ATP-binding protein [Candidatus Dactylopiibacterium carminicum]PAS98883.1 MAG: nitrate ABC transporter ATP-binding protein [Candidatus Dactylopiibacterium carminicum]
MNRPFIELSDVTLRYGRSDNPEATLALARTTLSIDDGDFVALVGPSGCGKSTILKLIGGLLTPSSGGVVVNGREVGDPRRARIGLAFQNPTMLPWLTIRDNVMMPLKIVEPFRSAYRRMKHSEYADRAEALLAAVGLKGFGAKRPWQLSGGMLQRASLCRALIHEPQLLLLDEPFGALDQFTREAAYLANRICVMSARPGRILEDRMVGFPRPRDVAMSYAPEFSELVQALRLRIAEARAPGEPPATPTEEAA